MKEENIGVLSAGERFGFKGFEWIVLDNNVDGGVLAIMASAWNNEEYSFDDDGCNNYAITAEYTSANAGADKNRIKYRGGSPQWWWLRTPNTGNGSNVRYVGTDGRLDGHDAHGSYGVAPACNVI